MPRLTTKEAEAGVRPPIMTRDQWTAMFVASMQYERDAHDRTRHAYYDPEGQFAR